MSCLKNTWNVKVQVINRKFWMRQKEKKERKFK